MVTLLTLFEGEPSLSVCRVLSLALSLIYLVHGEYKYLVLIM